MYEVLKMGRLYKLSVKILLDLFECIFNNIAMEIHNIHDSALFNEENVIAQSSTVDTSETDPKQMLSHSMTTDTLTGSVVYTLYIPDLNNLITSHQILDLLSYVYVIQHVLL